MNDIEQYLCDAVFYPCSGLDGAPVRFLAKQFPRFFYADYSIEREQFDNACERPGFRGYRLCEICDLDEKAVFGDTWEHIGQEYREFINKVQFEWTQPFVAIAHFQRMPEFGQDHGPENFDLMYARCEAIAAYHAVFTRRAVAPKCLAYIRSGIGFGGNYSEFPRELNHAVREYGTGTPEFIFYDQLASNPQTGDYLPLVEGYDRIQRWDYRTECYGMGNVTLARRRNGEHNAVPDANTHR